MDDTAKSGAFIIGLTDRGEAVCAAGGRISTQNGTALEILDKSLDKDKNASLISKVTRSGHTSTIEHIFFNLAFENVSVVVEQFMIEFRLASFTVKSRRYVDFSGCGYYVPEFETDSVRERYCAHMDYLFNEYEYFLEKGINKEDARFLLPYCFKSNFYCSLNGRELVLVLKRMLYGSAARNAEIKAIGQQLLAQARQLAPGVFAEFESRQPQSPDIATVELKLPEKVESKEPKPLTELIAYTPDAEKAIALSYLIGTGDFSGYENELVNDSENLRAILEAVLCTSRPRSLEAASFTFRVNNVSLSCITHFARHRIQGIIVPPLSKSQRRSFIIPPAVRDDKDLLDRYNTAFLKTAELYEELKSEGIDENELVYCLLSGNVLDITVTMNARELLLFLKLRTCRRAQWEIQAYAVEMLNKLRELYPTLFSKYGPSCCCEGRCPEGRLSCGNAEEVRRQFSVK